MQYPFIVIKQITFYFPKTYYNVFLQLMKNDYT